MTGINLLKNNTMTKRLTQLQKLDLLQLLQDEVKGASNFSPLFTGLVEFIEEELLTNNQ